ncbi:hypothetical protein BJX99DRAFT_58363 [Aspergillus californicus]
MEASPPQILRHLDANNIHFTPVKNSIVPRVWERKPSTSYLARPRPRKVWKRFRSSFNSMKSLQKLIAPGGSGSEESDLMLEINTRRNTADVRGVKRQCLAEERSPPENEGVEACSGRGRSFLETKWEADSRKARKLPVITNSTDEHMIDDYMQDEEDDEMAEIGDIPGGTTSTDDITVQDPGETGESPTLTPEELEFGAAYPDTLPGEPDCLPSEERGVIVNIKSLDESDQVESPKSTTTSAADGIATEDESDVTTANQLPSSVATVPSPTEDQPAMADSVPLTADQESTLVRSALRSSLGGEDTELLNNFLSKAKAKREAKAAAEAEAPTVAQDHEEQPHQPPCQQVTVEIPTPERRVLEALNANSPSPQKSPSKSPGKPTGKDENAEDKAAPPAGPGARRSTRVKSLQRATAPSVRTTLSLRRARGTEFVFLQRTEAQALALLTRKNTRDNKGESSLPKFTLQGLARQAPDSSPAIDDNIRRAHKPKKFVTWNEERMVEFEGDGDKENDEPATQDAKPANTPEKKKATSSGPSQTHASLTTGGPEKDATAATASPTATRGRRVRRLGPTKIDSTSFNASSPQSPTSSPVANRKKLTPKTRTPSKVPTSVFNNHEKSSLLSGGRSVKTNLLKVNAGSTPMPRRVRRA